MILGARVLLLRRAHRAAYSLALRKSQPLAIESRAMRFQLSPLHSHGRFGESLPLRQVFVRRALQSSELRRRDGRLHFARRALAFARLRAARASCPSVVLLQSDLL